MAPIILKIKSNENDFASFADLEKSEDYAKTWKTCTKVKDTLENGNRLENLSWRLWHLHQAMVESKKMNQKQFKKLSSAKARKMEHQPEAMSPRSRPTTLKTSKSPNSPASDIGSKEEKAAKKDQERGSENAAQQKDIETRAPGSNVGMDLDLDMSVADASSSLGSLTAQEIEQIFASAGQPNLLQGIDMDGMVIPNIFDSSDFSDNKVQTKTGFFEYPTTLNDSNFDSMISMAPASNALTPSTTVSTPAEAPLLSRAHSTGSLQSYFSSYGAKPPSFAPRPLRSAGAQKPQFMIGSSPIQSFKYPASQATLFPQRTIPLTEQYQLTQQLHPKPQKAVTLATSLPSHSHNEFPALSSAPRSSKSLPLHVVAGPATTPSLTAPMKWPTAGNEPYNPVWQYSQSSTMGLLSEPYKTHWIAPSSTAQPILNSPAYTALPSLVTSPESQSQQSKSPTPSSVPKTKHFHPTPSESTSTNSEQLHCENCQTTSTPLWRRSSNDTLLCNACGLYLKLHNTHRPKSLLRPTPTKTVVEEETECVNCLTRTTPLWRRGEDGRALCNACGLYWKLHAINRPLGLRGDGRKRTRNSGAAGEKRRKRNKVETEGTQGTNEGLPHEGEAWNGGAWSNWDPNLDAEGDADLNSTLEEGGLDLWNGMEISNFKPETISSGLGGMWAV